MKTPTIRREIELDEFVIMPNHFHAIVYMYDANAEIPLVGAYGHTPYRVSNQNFIRHPEHWGRLFGDSKDLSPPVSTKSAARPALAVRQEIIHYHRVGTEYEKIAMSLQKNPIKLVNG